ncbi:MAG: sigma54 specific transcriptional regulator, Fis family [Acidobacteriales bacterium]|nr:sigma54 specific transcriptional regulator, Fis family [Terriglobales bacterium]
MPRKPSNSTATATAPQQLAAAAIAAYAAADPTSLRLIESAKKVAAAASTVLIHGESGTGKDLIASLIHYLGPSPEHPLVKIDCASLPHELLESELFGFERGAFTGANQMKRGRLELAGNGTLVLDEISALSLAMQAKLLRVIEERRFDRLGGTRPIVVSARIIALTNVNLADAVARRTFREDLYYRLNVVPLELLPLRERTADIPVIAARLLTLLAEQHRRPHLHLAPDALAALRSYAFPGNVRELRNLLERTLINAPTLANDSFVTLGDLPVHVRSSSGGAKSKPSLEQLERAYIAEILDYTRGKKTKAAEILGISRKTLLEKRKKYQL